MTSFLIYLFVVTWPLFLEGWANNMTLRAVEGIPALDITRVYCILIICLTLFHRLMDRRKLTSDSVVFTTFLFSVYFIFEIIFNNRGVPLSTTLAILFQRFVIPCILYFCMINVQDKLNKKHLIYAVLLGGLYISCTGIIEFVIGHNVFGPINALSNDQVSGLYRTNGPFFDVISYASTVLCFVPFAYWALKECMINKLFAYLCIMLFSLGALATFSRAAWIALILGCCILWFGTDFKKVFVLFFLVAIFGIMAYLISDWFFASKLYRTRLAVGDEGRYKMYMDALTVSLHAPLFGQGVEMYTKKHSLSMHNTFLMILLDFGIIGLLLYLLSIFYLFFHGIISSSSSAFRRYRISLAIMTILVANTVGSLGNSAVIMALYITAAVSNMDAGDQPMPLKPLYECRQRG